MEWTETRRRTLSEWRSIRAGVGRNETVDLLTAINAISAACEKAREEAGREGERCRHCAFFGDARTCLDQRFAITEALLEGEHDEARSRIDDMLERIEDAPLPEAARPA